MVEDQSRILDMLSEGKITVDEAERLLALVSRTAGREHESSRAPGEQRQPLERLSVTVEPPTDAESADTRDDTFEVGSSPKLVVNNFNGRITVVAGTQDAIRVQARLKNASQVDYRASQNGDTVTVEAKRKGKTSLFGFLGQNGGAEISVTAPPSTNVELESSNSRIELRGIEGSGTLRTSNGRIVMEDVRGVLDAATSNSRIELKGMEGSGTLRTSNGRIVIENARGDFNASTSNGSVSFRGELTPGGKNQLRTSNGSVSVRLEGTPSLKVDASTSNGSIASRLPVLTSPTEGKHRLIGTIGNGEAELLIRTTNGSVNID